MGKETLNENGGGNSLATTSLVLDELSVLLEELGVNAVLLTIAEDFDGQVTEEEILNSPRLAPIAALLNVVELCKQYQGRYHEGLFVNLVTKAIESALKDRVEPTDPDDIKP